MSWATIPLLALLGVVYILLKNSKRFEDRD